MILSSKYQLIHQVDFILVDGMSHMGVNLLCNRSIHFFQDAGGSVDPFNGYMGVGVTGANKHRRVVKIAFVILLVDLIANQTTRKGSHTTILSRIPGHKFKCQAGAL